MGIWKKIKKGLPFIGIAIFVYLLAKLNVLAVLQQIGRADLKYLAISIVFVSLCIIFQTLKWWLVARKQNIKVPFREAIRINFISDFYGFITPSKIGSLIRAEYLKKYSNNVGKGISNFVIDKILDLTSLFFIAVAFGFFFKDKFHLSLGYIFLVFLCLMLGFLVFYSKERTRKILRVIYTKFVPEKSKKKVKITFDSFYEDLPKKRFLAKIFFVNIFAWLLNYTATYFIGRGLGIELGFIYFLAILPLATLIAQIPITISGLGTREAALISLFGLFGIEAVRVFSMSLVNIFITGVIPAIIALFLIFKKNVHNIKGSGQKD